MDVIGKLNKKTFIDSNGELHEYYVLQFELYGGEVLEITVKGDKAKLLIMSQELNNK